MSEQFERLRAALSERYRLEGEAGRGGMATVYLAEDLRHNRRVAVKVLRPELSAALGGERFLKEIQVTAGLQHPDILPLYDSGEADGHLYYVMPFIEGETLRDRLVREGRLGLDEALDIARSVAAALQFAHERGVVHRDVKPRNILLQSGRAILADFGVSLAIAEAGGARLTETGLSVGTPRYMSPEQAAGTTEVDHRSDVHALGAIVYEMLAGDPPFTGRNTQAVLAQLLTEEPVPLRRVRPDVPEVVDAAVMRALAKTPGDRFDTVAEFAAELASARTTDSGASLPPQRIRRARTIAIGAVALVVVAVAAAVALVRSGPESTQIRSLAVLPFQLLAASGETQGQETLVQGIHSSLSSELSRLTAQSQLTTVISPRSTLRFGDSDLSTSEIGAALEVDALVDGALQRVGDEISLNVFLVHAPTDNTVWSGDYSGELADVLTLQREMARDIASEIALSLSAEQEAHLAESREIAPEAFDLYWSGREQWNRRTEEGFRRAIEYFEEALEIEPMYAEAHAALSDTYNLLGQYQFMSANEAKERAEEAANRAIEIDPDLAEAYTSLAEINFLDREWAEAERLYREALRLRPGYATGHHFYGWFLTHMGRHEEAIAELERARRHDPFSAIIHTDLAAAYADAGRFEEALARIERALELEPGFSSAHWRRWLIRRWHGGLEEESSGAAMAIMNNAPGTTRMHYLAAEGPREEALAIVEREIREAGGAEAVHPQTAAWFTLTYIELDEHDIALDWLEYAVDRGLSAGAVTFHGPMLDPLRSDPRFAEIMEEMDFPE